MNLARTLVVVVTLLVASRSEGQSRCSLRPNVVLADLGLHVVDVAYQRSLQCWVSVQVSAGLYSPWLMNNNYLGLPSEAHTPPGDVVGGILRLRAFFYPESPAPAGPWVSPFVQTGVVQGTRDTIPLIGAAFAAGVGIGWAWLVRERFLISLGGGGQLHLATFAASTAFPGFVRFGPHLDVNVGYAF